MSRKNLVHPASVVLRATGVRQQDVAAALDITQGEMNSQLAGRRPPHPALGTALRALAGSEAAELIEKLVAESRAGQGLPPKVTNSEVLGRIAELVTEKAGALMAPDMKRGPAREQDPIHDDHQDVRTSVAPAYDIRVVR
jgi:hypothetical protein